MKPRLMQDLLQGSYQRGFTSIAGVMGAKRDNISGVFCRWFSKKARYIHISNNKITSPTGNIHLILDNGENFGEVDLKEALEMAKEKQLDLVQISSKQLKVPLAITSSDESNDSTETTETTKDTKDAATKTQEILHIPVCKIMDFSTLKEKMKESHEASKSREKEVLKRERQTKEVQIGTSISDHDLSMKMAQIERFLEKDKLVLLVIRFKRSTALEPRKRPMKGKEILENILEELQTKGLGAERKEKRMETVRNIKTQIRPLNLDKGRKK